MNKQKILEWLDKGISEVKKEQTYNENSHKNGTFPTWVSKEKGGLHQVMNNWYGYESIILQLDNIKNLLIVVILNKKSRRKNPTALYLLGYITTR